MRFKNPLSIFIVWHPEYTEGQKIADYLYSFLCRDSSKPLVRALGIPVYFRSKKFAGYNKPLPIDFTESEFTAVIALISDEFVIDTNYSAFIDSTFDQCNLVKDKRRLFPVSLSKNAFKVSSKLAQLNFVRTDVNQNIERQIKSPILHELCRLMMNMKRSSEETTASPTSPPIKLFISHSKHDGAKQDSLNFRDYINSQTQLKTFFDANDISFGSNFGDVIREAASESALVVFQSDSYAEREWCRIELLEAKLSGCPIVIVNDVQDRERRIFPYMGNYPSIRFKNNFLDIIDLTLEQVLLNRFTAMYLDALTDLYEIKTERILSTSPELFHFIQLKKDGLSTGEEYGLVIYPDPPLGSEEIAILNKLDDNYIFITPLTLPSISLKS